MSVKEFKSGDRVRRIGRDWNKVKVGDTCTVKSYGIGALTLEEVSGEYDSEYFELISNPSSFRELQPGDTVKIICEEAHHGWGQVSKGDIGVLSEQSFGGSWYINFPNQSGFLAKPDELELVNRTPQAVIQGANTVLSLTKDNVSATNISIDEAVKICKDGLIEIEAIRAKMREAEAVMKANGIRFI